MSQAFSFDIHVVACDECGAPLEVGAAGGRKKCAFCGCEHQGAPPSRAVPRGSPPAEERRLVQLRGQDGQAIAPPPDLAALFVGVDLVPWKVAEALALCKLTRAALRDQPTPADAERLQRLTLALADHFGLQGDPLRQRALLESSLELLDSPHHRQAVCAALARSACHAGDQAAAEAWLELCDPRPTDLPSDTAYRLARATVDTARGEFGQVLEVLGRQWEIPIADEHEAACVALRAHAIEQLGQSERAIGLLDQFMAHTSGFVRFLCARFVAQHQDWQLCAQCYPEAERRQLERGVRVAGKTAGAPLAGALLTVGALGAGLVAAVPLFFFVGFGWAVFAVGWGLLFAALCGAIALKDRRLQRRAQRLRAQGVPAAAQLLHASGTNVATMGVPQLLCRVLVLPAEGAPFATYSVFHADTQLRTRLTPGSLFVARFDPSDHSNVQLELD